MVKILLLDLRRLSHSALLPRQLVPIVAVLKQLKAWKRESGKASGAGPVFPAGLEMGTVPLLTRDGEVEIAKRIERGQLRVRQVLSRTPIMIKEIMSLGEGLKRDPNSIKDVITFTEDDLTESTIENKYAETIAGIGEGGDLLDRPFGNPVERFGRVEDTPA